MKDNIYSKEELVIKLQAFIDAIENDDIKTFARRLHNLILLLKRYESRRNKNLSFLEYENE